MQKFKNTSEIEVLDEILGQERAIRAMEVGLKIDNPAYNIYVSGHSINIQQVKIDIKIGAMYITLSILETRYPLV